MNTSSSTSSTVVDPSTTSTSSKQDAKGREKVDLDDHGTKAGPVPSPKCSAPIGVSMADLPPPKPSGPLAVDVDKLGLSPRSQAGIVGLPVKQQPVGLPFQHLTEQAKKAMAYL